MKEIATYFDPEEAHIARGFLQANGFDARLADSHTLAAIPLDRIALGGYRLMVPQEQAYQAELLLRSVAEEHQDRSRCPACDSPRIARGRKRVQTLLHSWILSILPFSGATKIVYCRDCGHKWSTEDAEAPTP